MKHSKTGFTLVELLVVITIIGILMGLLIPAVNAARESARRNQCATNMKNLALAGVQHEGAKGKMPGYVNRFGFYAGDGAGGDGDDPSEPGTLNNVPPHVKIGTWAVGLLPWLDAQPTYEHWTEDRYPLISISVTGNEYEPTNNDREAGVGFHPLAAPNLGIFQCPSNPNSTASNGRNSYISNNGTSLFRTAASVAGINSSAPPPGLDGSTSAPAIADFVASQKRANGAFNNQYQGTATTSIVGSDVRLDDFKDGQGFTILFSENMQALPWHRAGYLNATEMVVASPAVDLGFNPINPAIAANPLFAAQYTNGMVWHYEDKDSSMPARNVLSGAIPVQAVFEKHKINGGGQAVGQDIYTLQMNETSLNFIDLARPSSAHVDGVNAAFADGATRYIVETIDYRVYQALCTLRGKSSDVPFTEFVLTDELD